MLRGSPPEATWEIPETDRNAQSIAKTARTNWAGMKATRRAGLMRRIWPTTVPSEAVQAAARYPNRM